jgi:hypothetical protein
MSENTPRDITGFLLLMLAIFIIFIVALYYDWKNNELKIPRWRDRSNEWPD